jgi:hypothetical protein
MASPRSVESVDYFQSTDIQHIAGAENHIADSLSRDFQFSSLPVSRSIQSHRQNRSQTRRRRRPRRRFHPAPPKQFSTICLQSMARRNIEALNRSIRRLISHSEVEITAILKRVATITIILETLKHEHNLYGRSYGNRIRQIHQELHHHAELSRKTNTNSSPLSWQFEAIQYAVGLYGLEAHQCTSITVDNLLDIFYSRCTSESETIDAVSATFSILDTSRQIAVEMMHSPVKYITNMQWKIDIGLPIHNHPQTIPTIFEESISPSEPLTRQYTTGGVNHRPDIVLPSDNQVSLEEMLHWHTSHPQLKSECKCTQSKLGVVMQIQTFMTGSDRRFLSVPNINHVEIYIPNSGQKLVLMEQMWKR